MSPPSSRAARRPAVGRPVRGPGVVASLNVGSSSLKFAIFERGARGQPVRRRASGKFEGIGTSASSVTIVGPTGVTTARRKVRLDSQRLAVREFLRWVESSPYQDRLDAVGHRVVRGDPAWDGPQRVTPRLLRRLRAWAPLDPDHLPAELDAIRLVHQQHPEWVQVACFDTAFHRTMPPVARRYALPRRWTARGVIRYGFHGLSCQSIVEALASVRPAARFPSRLVVAHLGSGCSLTAIRHGRSLDTTMGFTPTGGLVMSTRSGDLDPEVVVYLVQHAREKPGGVSHLLNHRSGLLGISGTTGEMQRLLRRAPTDRRARESVELFSYQAQKHLAGLVAALGGIDTLVFTGGIGENSPEIRRRISAGLAHLGARVDPRRNAASRPVISTRSSRVVIRVIPTDEERVIASQTQDVLSSRAARTRGRSPLGTAPT
jgi:acetate kinase